MDQRMMGLPLDLISDNADIANKAWKKLYHELYPQVQNYIRKLGGTEEDAVDIFQDCLVVLNYNLKNNTFRGESSLKTYLLSICKNLWLKECQHRRKKTMLQADLSNDLQEDLNYIDNVNLVSSLMMELKEDCRKILTEFYYNNRSMEELKVIFNVNSTQAAKNKKWRCLSYLVRLFKERGHQIVTAFPE